jgi:bifunctional non-homologous end joining protein LigD
MPRTQPLALAMVVEAPPDGDEWLHEIKHDGYRIVARIEEGEVRLVSRNGKDWTKEFPQVARAVGRLPAGTALLDGEVAAVLPSGATSFQALQRRGMGAPAPLVYFAFDLLHLDGEDLAARPLLERKAALANLLGEGRVPIRYAPHVEGSGASVFREACRLGLEGIVSKRADLPYRPGRNAGWVKTKCILRQELVIGGFTEPEGAAREGLGALLLGFHEGGALRFAGKVGTGFTNAQARALRARLGKLATGECPFTPRPPGWLGKNAHWVRPELVAEVAFTEWTKDGSLRHPSFQGLREDKKAKDVVRERPSATPTPTRRPVRSARKPATEIAGVRISNPDRVVYPDLGLTKADVARYYEAVADAIVPHLRGRPLTLYHCPEGLTGECRFMKHSKVWAPEAVRRVAIREKRKTGEYLVVNGATALLSVVQMDVLELHTWNSTTERLEDPDRLVLDLDPGPEVRFADVVRAARLVRDALAALGLASFVKTTGGVGLHVVVPLVPARPWHECLAFSRAFAATIARHDPRRFTTAFAKAGRE